MSQKAFQSAIAASPAGTKGAPPKNPHPRLAFYLPDAFNDPVGSGSFFISAEMPFQKKGVVIV